MDFECMRGEIGAKNDGHAKVEFPEEIPIPDYDDHVGF